MTAEKKVKKDTWTKPRHKVVTALAMPVFSIYIKWRYNVDIRPFKDQGDRPYLVMMNHQTTYDQFFIATAFQEQRKSL